MATTVDLPGTLESREPENRLELDAIARAVELGSGGFHLIFVEYDLPHWRTHLVSELASRIAPREILEVDLAPPPPDASAALNVLDQLQAQVEARSRGVAPYALLVTGYEKLLPKVQGTLSRDESEQLLRALEPLNVGRSLLPRLFPYPLLFCLPSDWMPLLDYAPDFKSWAGGFYRLTSDRERVLEEIRDAAAMGAGFWGRSGLRRRSSDDLEAELDRLIELSADAAVLDVESTVRLQVDERLGWVALALQNRGEAEAAFRRIDLLTRKPGGEQWNKRAQRGLAALKRLGRTVTARQQGNPAALPGAGAVAEPGGLFGRDQEIREILARIASEDPRMLIIWGETGSGKTSLLQAGIVARLAQSPGYLPLLIRDWDHPSEAVFRSLANAAQLFAEPSITLPEIVEMASKKSRRTVVVICDQFEQFFAQQPDRHERNKMLAQFAKCINDVRLNCRFVFVLPGDELSRMIELETYVPNIIEERKRFYLPLFETSAALRALNQLASRANANWPPPLIESVVEDLQVDGRVRPIQLQLTAFAMVLAGIDDKKSYYQAGRAQGLLADYLDLVLESLSEKRRERGRMKRILLALIDDDQKRDALAVPDIAKRSGLNLSETVRLLALLVKGKLVRAASLQEASTVVEWYELTHDALVPLILGASDQRVQANRLLRSALAKFRSRRFYALSWTEQRLIESYADPSRLRNSEAIRLLRRSSWYRFARNLLPFLALLVVYLGILVCFRFFAIDQPDTLNRLVVRRGLPWLSGLPGESMVLDTGYSGNQLKPGFQQRGEWFWNLGPTADPLLRRSLTNSLTSPWEVQALECLMDSERCWRALTGQNPGRIDLRDAAIEMYPERKWIEAAKNWSFRELSALRLSAHYPLASSSIFSATSPSAANSDWGAAAILGFQIAVRSSPALQEQCLSRLHSGDARAAVDLLLAIRETPDLARRIYPDLARLFDEFRMSKIDKSPLDPATAASAVLAAIRAAPDLAAEAYPLMLSQLRDTAGGPWQFAFATVLLRNSYEPARAKEWVQRQWPPRDWAVEAVDNVLPYVEVAKTDPDFRASLVKEALAFNSKPQVIQAEGSLADAVVLLFGAGTPVEAGRIAGGRWLEENSRGPTPWLIKSAETTTAFVSVFKAACYEQFFVQAAGADVNSVYLYQGLLRIAPEYPRDPKRSGKDVFDYLVDSNPNYRAGAAYGIASILVHLAEQEPAPAKFLLDHLEGRRSILPGQNATTLAPYRDAAASAIALWLNSDHPAAIRGRQSLEAQVRALMHDDRMYIRAAAWRAIDESASLMERKARESLELPW